MSPTTQLQRLSQALFLVKSVQLAAAADLGSELESIVDDLDTACLNLTADHPFLPC